MYTLLEANWHSHLNPSLSPTLRGWLQAPGSFMERLKQHGIMDARVQVLRQHWQFPETSERKLLKLSEKTQVLVREVYILNDTTRFVFARSLFPASTLSGKERQLGKLKTRALGSVLFQDTTMQRGEFEFSCLHPGMILHEKMRAHVKNNTAWARRSLFFINGKPLLLMEAFTPEMMFI